ncbi:MAG TPA: hypothetical protein PLB55_22085 [Prosthecobacter sp.]|nr:hypothetical protein [Prosthecobacter sp.]
MRNVEWMILAAALFVPLVHAQEARPVQHVHQAGRIRLFYHMEGQHAVDAADVNRNGVPDAVEDVLTQTQAAQTLFVDVLGFPDPFSTERFRTAAYLDIHFRHKDLLKANGVTYDELQHFNHSGDPKGTVSICFNVATSVRASANLTPAHEFFHLIQNSTTYFKNRWFTEGTARWSERGLGVGDLGPARVLSAWPLSQTQCAELSARTYDASEHFWNPLARRTDATGEIPDSPALAPLKAMTYADGTPVLKDLRLTGWRFIRDVLRAFDHEDNVAFKELGYDRWSEENQKSPKNDVFILRAVLRALEKSPPPGP